MKRSARATFAAAKRLQATREPSSTDAEASDEDPELAFVKREARRDDRKRRAAVLDRAELAIGPDPRPPAAVLDETWPALKPSPSSPKTAGDAAWAEATTAIEKLFEAASKPRPTAATNRRRRPPPPPVASRPTPAARSVASKEAPLHFFELSGDSTRGRRRGPGPPDVDVDVDAPPPLDDVLGELCYVIPSDSNLDRDRDRARRFGDHLQEHAPWPPPRLTSY